MMPMVPVLKSKNDKCFIDEKDGKMKCPVFSDPRKIYDIKDVKIKQVDAGNPKLGISRKNNPVVAVKEAVDKIGGMCSYVNDKDLVAIKLNVTGGISTNKASYTSPEVASAVVDMVRKCGGKPFMYDSSMIWTDLEPIAKKEGWYEWAKKNSVELIDIHNMPVIPFNFGKDGVIENDKASRLLQESDVLINIAKMKTHMLTTVSMGLKNNYGNLPRADKGVYHAKDIDSVIVDVNKAFPTTLTIIDGMIAGEGEAGPLTPDPINDYNTIFASNDVVCADSSASIFMGYDNPMKIRHIRFATEKRVGDGNCYLKDDVKKEIDENFGKHAKDGNFILPDPDVIETLGDITKLVARNPGGIALFNNLADFGLGNLSYFFTRPMADFLKSYTKIQKRYLGKDLEQERNIHGLNMHPEDDIDFAF